ncbi:MAG: hypothetical protein R2880_02470 [Deinococcales bacterium]
MSIDFLKPLSSLSRKMMMIYLGLMILLAALSAYNLELSGQQRLLELRHKSLSEESAALSMRLNLELSPERLRDIAYAQGMVPYLENQGGQMVVFQTSEVALPQLEQEAQLKVLTRWR